MDVQHKAMRQMRSERESATGHVVTVAIPEPYEGIGNALRATYAPGRDGVPDDMMALLAKLELH